MLIQIAEGVYTDSQESADLAREQAAFDAWDRTWNPVEGKWEY